MKIIRHELLWSKPELWHKAMREGDFNGVSFIVADEFPFNPPIQFESVGITMNPVIETVAKEKICSVCEWNIDWLCQHSGCLPCKQKAAGGLREYLRQNASQCPAGKWVY